MKKSICLAGIVLLEPLGQRVYALESWASFLPEFSSASWVSPLLERREWAEKTGFPSFSPYVMPPTPDSASETFWLKSEPQGSTKEIRRLLGTVPKLGIEDTEPSVWNETESANDFRPVMMEDDGEINWGETAEESPNYGFSSIPQAPPLPSTSSVPAAPPLPFGTGSSSSASSRSRLPAAKADKPADRSALPFSADQLKAAAGTLKSSIYSAPPFKPKPQSQNAGEFQTALVGKLAGIRQAVTGKDDYERLEEIEQSFDALKRLPGSNKDDQAKGHMKVLENEYNRLKDLLEEDEDLDSDNQEALQGLADHISDLKKQWEGAVLMPSRGNVEAPLQVPPAQTLPGSASSGIPQAPPLPIPAPSIPAAPPLPSIPNIPPAPPLPTPVSNIPVAPPLPAGDAMPDAQPLESIPVTPPEKGVEPTDLGGQGIRVGQESFPIEEGKSSSTAEGPLQTESPKTDVGGDESHLMPSFLTVSEESVKDQNFTESSPQSENDREVNATLLPTPFREPGSATVFEEKDSTVELSSQTLDDEEKEVPLTRGQRFHESGPSGESNRTPRLTVPSSVSVRPDFELELEDKENSKLQVREKIKRQ
ncbi:MAG: hypothetical protein LBR62_00650, partial [Puniceicoccales bacterium]|nr:hypothetical protein [Puniceicoccales bacterium]